MRKILLRIENLLLVVPLMLLLVQQLFFSTSTVDIHLHDAMVVIGTAYLLGLLFLLLFFYYSLHFLLRTRKRRGAFACNFHAVATTICLILIFVFAFLPEPLTGITDYKEMENVLSGNRLFNYMAICVFLLFIILQLFFLIYFLFRIVSRSDRSEAAGS